MRGTPSPVVRGNYKDRWAASPLAARNAFVSIRKCWSKRSCCRWKAVAVWHSYRGQVQGALRCGLKAVPAKFYDVAFRKRALLHIEVGLQNLGLSEAAYKGGADLNAKCHISREWRTCSAPTTARGYSPPAAAVYPYQSWCSVLCPNRQCILEKPDLPLLTVSDNAWQTWM